MGVGSRVSRSMRVMPALADNVEYLRNRKSGTMNSGLEATVGDQGMTGDEVELGGY